MRGGLALWILLAVVAAAGTSEAAGSRRLAHRAEQWAEGRMEGLAVDALGQLRPAAVRATVLEADAFYLWSLARDRSGRLLAGSGDGGTVFRVEGDALVPWARTLAFEILCLLPTENGVLAGSSPDGVVHRIDERGGVTVALDLPQQSVWALAPGEERGEWIAAAGPPARLVRVGPSRPAGERLAELPATNATALLRDEGGLWIATQGPALLYRLPRGSEEPELRFEAPEDEIRALRPDGRGGVWVLSVRVGATEPRPPGNAPSASNGKGPEPRPQSRLSWVGPEGGSETLLTASERFLSLLDLPGGGFLLGEAESGRIHRVDEAGRRSLWVELGGGDVLALHPDEDGRVAAATGNPAALHLLEPGAEPGGSFVSPVVAAPQVERWGRLWAEGEAEGVRVATRSGVRAEPDESWSAWGESQALGTVIDAPVRPHLQYRLELSGDAEGTAITAIHLAWSERNAAPRVEELRVEPAGAPLASGGVNTPPAPVSQRFADGLAVEYNVYPPRTQAPPETAAWARGLRTVRWRASDPDGDLLRYRLQLRREPDGQWYPLAEELEGEVFAWDTRAFDDGRYRLRVIASDAPSNAPGRERSGELIGAVVHVDNRAPGLEELRWADDGSLRARLRDEGSPLREIALRWGEEAWRPLEPADGVLDGRSESIELSAETLAEAERYWLRVVDAAGNVTVQELRREGDR